MVYVLFNKEADTTR